MRKTITGRWSLAGVGLLWVVGCAHDNSAKTCTACQQQAAAKANKDAVAAKPDDNSRVWTVVRDPKADKNSFVIVEPASLSASVTATADPKQSTSLKPAPNGSPFNASVPPVVVSDPTVKIPAQSLTVPETAAGQTQQPSMVLPQSTIGANPNLKMGQKEIVRDNVPKTLAHADDYTWVMGELEYLHSKKVWRIRYQTYDKEDKHGGCFTLVGCEDKLTHFVHGDLVKIEGFVVESDTKQIAPEYKVSDIVPLVTREVVDVKVEEKK